MENIDHSAGNVAQRACMAAGSRPDWRNPRLATVTAGSRSLFLAMLLVTGSAFLLYAETFASMIVVWRNSSTFVHGFLVLPISAILIWKRRGALRAGAARPSPAGFVFLVLAVCFWLLSSEAYAQAGQHLAFIAILVTGIWSVLGTVNARAIRFPLLFAFFSVPFGEFLIPPLMDWTAGFTVWALNATGIPVYLEAYLFTLPSGTFEVVEACSGIRYFLVTIVIAICFAHERFSSLTRRSLFVLGAAAAIIVANGIRAYVIVLVAHLSQMKLGTGQDHIYFGWFLFIVMLLLIFWVGDRFADAAEPSGAPKHGGAVIARDGAEGVGGRTTLFALIGAITIIALGPGWQQVTHAAPLDNSTIVRLPRALEPWSGPGPAVLAYRPSFTGDFEAAHAGFSSADGDVDVHGIFFAKQSQGSELVGEGSRIYDARWRLVRRLETESVSVQGRTMQVNSLVVADGQQEFLLWYWYDVGGRLTSSDLATKFYHAIQGVLGRNKGDAALILATPASMSGDGSDSSRLEQFLDGHLAALGACLRSASLESANCTDPL